MSFSKKVFYSIFFISLDIFLIYGICTVYDATMLNTLRREVNLLENKEITKDSFSYKVLTRGGYAKIEEAIKEYLYDYSSLFQDVLKSMKDEKLKKVLSYDNYLNDGPLFEKSISYLEKEKDKFNKNIDQLLFLSSEDSMKSYVNQKGYQEYYQKLYEELFITDHFINEFKDNESLLESVKVKMNTIYDNSLGVLRFLASDTENWKLEDGEIKFQTQALYDQYMTYISQITNS